MQHRDAHGATTSGSDVELKRAPFGMLLTLAALAACGGGSGSPATAVPVPSPTVPFVPPSAAPAQHLYVGYASIAAGGLDYAIAEFSLPLASASSPLLLHAADGTIASFAVDPYRGTTAQIAGSTSATPGALQIVASIGASQPLVSIAPGPATIPATGQSLTHDIAFDPGGGLWVPTYYDLREFVAPFASYSVAARVIGAGIPASPYSAFAPSTPHFDPNGNLYTNGVQGQNNGGPLYVFSAPTFSTAPRRIAPGYDFLDLAFDGAGDAIAPFSYDQAPPTPMPSGTALPPTGLASYQLPLSSDSTPQFLIPAPDTVTNLSGMAVDSYSGTGTLFIGDKADGSVYAYALPLTATSKPLVKLACPAAFAAYCQHVFHLYLQPAP